MQISVENVRFSASRVMADSFWISYSRCMTWPRLNGLIKLQLLKHSVIIFPPKACECRESETVRQ